jgi:RNA polymerase sigma-70 factor (ECF subfamily)
MLVPEDKNDPLYLLVVRVRPELLAYFSRRGLVLAEAEDLTQETLLRFVRAGYDASAADAAPKMFRIAKNQWVDFLRAAAGGKAGAPPRSAVLSDEALDEAPDPEPLIEVQISDRQDLERVARAIRMLPHKCRIAFEYSRFDGLSYSEIAETMKISKSAVEKHISDAIKRISQAMEGGPR